MDDSKVFMFPEGSSKGSIDPALLMALNNNGGFGNNGAWIWILFMWMMWQNGGINGFGGNNGTGFLSNQLNNDAVHEAKHVQSHICNYYNVSEDGEQAAYLIGYIVQKMHKIFKYMISTGVK